MTLLERIQTMNEYELATLLWRIAQEERRKLNDELSRAGIGFTYVCSPVLDIASIVEVLRTPIDGDAS